jgi:hypothetical protein
VALVKTDFSENMSPSSSGFFRVIGFHTCITVESLIISLSIERYYVGSKNTVFCDVFTAVSRIDIFWDVAPCGCS